MPFRMIRAALSIAMIAAALATAGCDRLRRETFEYEEELYLSIDGSAVVTVSASEAALVALRGIDLRTGAHARPDRESLRAFFDGPGVVVRTPTFSRRHGRRFVHVTLEIADVRQLSRLAPFSWSRYRFDREGSEIIFRQVVGGAAGRPIADPGWDGSERVDFRMHVPSRVLFENATTDVLRGNIVAWIQPLAQRLDGVPLELEVRMESESILRNTLLLFVGTIAAAAVTFLAVIWWVVRRGRKGIAPDDAAAGPGPGRPAVG
jgi:hypothetical protein